MASRTSRKKKDQIPTQWSAFEWDSTRSCWSRYRLDRRGNYEFDYQPADSSESATFPAFQDSGNPDIPRYVPTLDTTQGGSSPTAFGTSPEYSYRNPIPEFSSMDLNKGKEPETDFADLNTIPYQTPVGAPMPIVMHTASSAEGTNDWNATRHNSLYNQYPQDSGVSSSQQPYNPYSQWQNTAAGLSSFAQPQQQQPPQNYIGPSTRGLDNPLDPQFKVHPGYEFKLGKVFRILWAEPTGINGTQLTEPREVVHSQSQMYQQNFVHKIRLFVVVKSFHGHCLCLPIQTYGRKATKKPGLQPEDHAAIYSEKLITFHENLSKKAIKVDMYNPRDKLAPQSRLNYAKVYTIEYNVKVFFIGRVQKEHRHQVLADYANTAGVELNEGSEEPVFDSNPSGAEGPSR